MKRFVVTSIAIAVAMLAAGAEAGAPTCKFRQNKTDDFTGEQLVKTDWFDMTTWASGTFNRTIGNRKDLEISAAIEGPHTFLKFRIKLSDAVKNPPRESDLYNALYVPQGSGLEITLADESIVESSTHSEVRGTTRAKYDDGTFVVSSKFTVHYPLDDAMLDRLVDEDVVYIRLAARGHRYDFVTDQGTIEFNINKKGQEAIKKVIDCLQQSQHKEAT